MTDRRFPLHWPPHVARTPARDRRPSAFKVMGAQAYAQLVEEAHRFGCTAFVISTNAPRSARTGAPYADALDDDAEDPGAALYLARGDRDLVFACDTFPTIRENLRAIYGTLESLRRIERYGARQMLAAAMAGFTALPSPDRPWHEVLGLPATATPDEIAEARKRLAREHHADGDRMKAINVAHDQGMEAKGHA